MARIQGPRKPGWLARVAFWYARRKFGRVMEPLKVVAHHRQILFAQSGYELAFARAHLVEGRVKELASIAAARQIGCPF